MKQQALHLATGTDGTLVPFRLSTLTSQKHNSSFFNNSRVNLQACAPVGTKKAKKSFHT